MATVLIIGASKGIGLSGRIPRRLLEPIGNIPPAEAEANYHATLKEPRMAA